VRLDDDGAVWVEDDRWCNMRTVALLSEAEAATAVVATAAAAAAAAVAASVRVVGGADMAVRDGEEQRRAAASVKNSGRRS
jgi:hypothetical protein